MKIIRFCAISVLFAALSPTAGAAPEEVGIVDPSTLTSERYEIVTRLWVDSWRSAFQVPTHGDQAAAIAELKSEAARRGANAITNVACLVDRDPLFSGPHFCYALAIKLKKQ
jgi:hypothetical protein